MVPPVAHLVLHPDRGRVRPVRHPALRPAAEVPALVDEVLGARLVSVDVGDRVIFEKVEAAAGFEKVRDDPPPRLEIREPDDRPFRGVHYVELPTKSLREIVEVRTDEPGGDS